MSATLALCFTLHSCGLEEPLGGQHNESGYIEFVARPVGFNNQVVQTKADENTVESKIENCFFLVFDAVTGNRVGIHTLNEISWNGSTPQVKLDTKGLQKVIACFLINVPTDFANEIIGTTKPDNAPAGDNNKYLNTAVLSDIIYKSGDDFGFPFIDIDGDDTTDPVACIPMLGVTPTPVDLNTTSISTTIQIPIKRLFAKVSIDLSLQLNLDGWTDIVQRSTYYKLNSYTLCNIPQKVALTSSAEESAWIATPSSFSTTSKGNLSQSIIYNKNGSYSFSFYVPEYYLNSIDNPSSDQRYKPENVKNGTCPIYIKLNGTYTEYSYRAATMEHSIYLGRNNHSDFSIERNTHYTNSLTIKGVTNNADSEAETNIDHRVTTSVIHNPVEIEGESANCYIIAQTGSYSFPAYKGAHKNLANAALCTGNASSYVEVLAKDNNSITISEPKYDKDNNFISFKVDNIADGNVVIALKNADGSIEWSWHLWCSTSSTIGDWIGNMTGWGEMDTQIYPSGSEMMDRNLGSKSATITLVNQNDAIGPYYKYGYKEPFIGGAYSGGGSIKNSNGNAIAATWGSTSKSPTDPCPPGYRIPQAGAFAGEATKEDATALGAFRYWNNGTTVLTTDDVYFPYSGYVGSDNLVKTGLGLESKYTHFKANDYRSFSIGDIRTQEDQIGNIEEKEAMGGLIKYETRTVGYTEYEYTDFEYEAKMNVSKIGYLWNSGDTHYEYSSKAVDWTNLKIVKCKMKYRQTTRQQQRTYELVNTGSFWRPNYQWQIQDDWYELTSPQTSEWSTAQDLTEESSNVIIATGSVGSINNESWRNSLKSNQQYSNTSHIYADSVSSTAFTDCGFQVRCIID